MKVLFMARAPAPAGPGGDLLRLLERLDRDEVKAVVVFPEEPGPSALAFQHEGAMVHTLGLPQSDKPRGLLISALGVHRLRKVLKELEADVAHGLDAPSSACVAVAGRAAGVPVLIGTWRDHEPAPISFGRRRALRKLDRIVVPSQEVASELGEVLGDRHPPVSVIRNGIDAGKARGFARSPEFAEPRLRVGTLAFLAEESGIEEIFEAAALVREVHPDFEWLIAGSGPRGMRYLRILQGAGLDRTVRLLGDREEVGPFLASLDAYVSPPGPDAVPAGLLQALVAGVPSVTATNPSLAALLVPDQDALLVPARDGRALADAVIRVFDDGAAPLRSRLRAAGKTLDQRGSADDTASAIAALYRSSIEDVRRRSR